MFRSIAVACALVLSCGPALAQKYPDRPVRVVVPFPPGGPLDVAARLFSGKLAEHFGQPFMVDNRAGAAGNIGMESVAGSAPDGHTILWVIDAMLTVNPILYPKLGDPLERLRPVTMVNENISTLVIHPSVQARSSAELVALSKTAQLSYGSAGLGSPGHRYMEFYKLLSGARLTHVPYKGNAPAVQSVLAGETQAFITPVTAVIAHIRAGRLRALAVTAAKGSPMLPDVPSMVALGYSTFNAVAWQAVLVPGKTPEAIVEALDRQLVRIIQLPEVRDRLLASGVEPAWDTGRAVISRAREERVIWAEVIAKTGMKID
jgi:tripartite-type tricarboxylate transporter receptor subunit TctC